ncbi:hypothetical protein FJR05_11170 [Dolichospermum sp. UHCC 0259]|nr:hypothetical protein [Dolichospermum sp. UHCC 0259]
MRFRNNQSWFSLFISSLATVIFINYLITGFIDYVHSINDLLNWLKQSGIGENLYRFFGGR